MMQPHSEPPIRRAGFGLAGAFLLVVYVMAAYIIGLWPLQLPPAAACPVTATNYQVFVDPTASNSHTGNWPAEAGAFARTLGSCDRVSFWIIDANSSSGAAYGEPLVFPLLDPNAPGAIVIDANNKIESSRAQVERRISEMMHLKGAARSDVIGIFNKLKPVKDRRNVLVVFSDGQESAQGVNLEDGHSCVTSRNAPALVDLALANRRMGGVIGRFDAVNWVVPASSGKLGCNSRDELRLFWKTLIERLCGTPRALKFCFDTNVFSVGEEYESH